MRFLKLTLAYDGTDYVGWQIQPNGPSIQETLESAWQRVTGEKRRIIASGRTDAGVHALGQVCSLSTGSDLQCDVISRALNANTPADISVLAVEEAPTNFHAIRDAVGKSYRYRIQYGPVADPLARRTSWYLTQSLDVGAMEEAGKYLIGRHDFVSFQAAGSERASTVRTVERLTVGQQSRDSFQHVEIEIAADGFLYNMARNIVGTLVHIGLGKRSPAWIRTVIDAKDRSAAAATAPARGLFLVSVRYD